jgi:hypothetical protein
MYALCWAKYFDSEGMMSSNVIEVDRAGKTDADQLAYASGQRRAVLTHNIRDFRQLDKQ